MDIYCLPEFKNVYEKLCKNNSYADLTQGIIDCFLDKKVSECIVGRNLNQSTIAPFLKRDLSGRSGFRLYYVALLKKEEIYLGFVHPKTGSSGSANTTSQYRSELVKEILDAIQKKEVLKISIEYGLIKFE
jgi:hypothetical protein